MNAKEKLIIALDVPTIEEAKNLVRAIGDEAVFYKVGLELMMSGGYFDLIKFLKDEGKKVFADLKFHDIPTTVSRAIKNLAQHQVDMVTIHAISEDIIQAAAQAKGRMKVVGVTVLTTYDQEIFNRTVEAVGFKAGNTLENLVLGRAKLALEFGLDGVVASALEAKKIRENCGKDFLIVTPGIRLSKDTELFKENKSIADARIDSVRSNSIGSKFERSSNLIEDQKRVTDVKTALANGASHLVVGRPITRDTHPKEATQKFVNLISDVYAS